MPLIDATRCLLAEVTSILTVGSPACLSSTPPAARSIVGTKHKRLIPASILVGGTFLVAADIISRVAVAPEELPIGVVSAFFGAPFFLYLIRKSHGTFGG